MLEKEFKFLLDKDTFIEMKNIAVAIFGNSSPLLQINYYYDDEHNSLNKQGITLRVRQTDGVLKLQKKSRVIKSETFVTSCETEKVIENLPGIIDDKYFLKGSLVTQRYIITPDKPGITLDFDINYYLGVCDYEVEIEFQNETENQAEDFIVSLGLNSLPSAANTEGKASRFYNKLKSL
jgi:uncharacterized protein YjbK